MLDVDGERHNQRLRGRGAGKIQLTFYHPFTTIYYPPRPSRLPQTSSASLAPLNPPQSPIYVWSLQPSLGHLSGTLYIASRTPPALPLSPSANNTKQKLILASLNTSLPPSDRSYIDRLKSLGRLSWQKPISEAPYTLQHASYHSHDEEGHLIAPLPISASAASRRGDSQITTL